ncbi:adenosylcobinamide-phosphate synthase CbiB [Lachnospiraceae bacterium SGI.256]|uniref:adenosylcobinamide-phosphate synthase CbiB n=1 Tax=Mediterraneibacter faecis TaxID=592978 RepID=UPI00243307B3|nr:adenosylcobinamide-phosphate synthase CbiB [Mediterraneibacter faecis]MCI7722750.1 adenosylcobinamide-phosphate synthase CbiB [Mediterraneibacter faecis]MDD7359753.1 adenosylcobinamide-phosphate synthase CbiB [Mediterraneibacter faecis]MDY3056751.1 adenosylcobinamide-phosphate synthase CbiB [Mediterraneibacter faecis]
MNGKMIILACVTGFLLDCIFGDPAWMYHPIRVIGNLISVLEKGLRKLLCSRIPASEQKKKNEREVLAGGILWILTVSLSFLVPAVLLFAAGKVHPAVRFLLETFWCYQIFAARCLVGESKKVYQKLKEDDLPGARRAVSMIVGRDTENLTAEGVTKAAVETVAENTSDGVTAPLLFLLIGGAPLGFLYKAVNTMDSMLGYKNEKYLYFGRIPAKMDDVFNYIPARLTAWFMVAAAFLTGMDGENAWKIYLRDKRKHASPNSAQSEAVCAGALDVQLAGDAVYFGKVYKKDYIGDAIRKIEPEDILRAGKLMYMTTILMMVVFGGLLLWIF